VAIEEPATPALNRLRLAWDDFSTEEPKKENSFIPLVLSFSCLMTSPKAAMIAGAAHGIRGTGDACAQPITARVG